MYISFLFLYQVRETPRRKKIGKISEFVLDEDGGRGFF